MRRHTAVPGPLYWEFRCLRCGGNVSDRSKHKWWWQRK